MAYTIEKSNGTTITVSDNSLDSQYSVRLIGKNRTNYGAPLNENFFRLMENFASASEPKLPQIGQIWWDSGNKLLKVRSGAGVWKTVSGTMVTEPAEPVQGDLWYDVTAKQLKVYNGSQWQVVGTSITAAGTSGTVPETFIDVSNNSFTVSSIYSNGYRVAVFSANTIINPEQSGFDTVYPGLNFNTNHGNLSTLNGNLNGTSAILSANVTAGNLISSGIISSVANITAGGNLIVTSAASVGTNLTVTGSINSGAVTSSANITAANVTISGVAVVTGNITGGNLVTSGTANVATLRVTGTSNLGPVGNVTITGGTNGQLLTTDGNGVLSWSTVSAGSGSGTVNSGTASHLTYYAASGNTVSGTGANLVWNGANLLSVTGNVAASNVTVNLTANVSTLEIVSLANIKATTAATSTTTGALRVAGGAGISGNIHAGGNLVAANVNTGILTASSAATLSSTLNVTGLITATAGLTTTSNIAAGNSAITSSLSAGTFSVTGMSTLGNVGNVIITGGSNGQVLTTNGTGNLTWTTVSAGGSGTVGSGTTSALAYYASSGTTVAGTTNLAWNNSTYVLTVTGTANVTTLNASGVTTTNSASITAATAATSTTTGALTVAGGAGFAGNIYAGGLLNVTGNANVGNIGAAAGVFTGAISGLTLTTSGNANVGNIGAAAGVFGGPLSGITTISASGNANVGNIGATSGVFTNISGTLTTASQTNITSVGTLSSLTVSGATNLATSSGNVGIGTSSPATKLDVQTASADTTIRSFTGTVGTSLVSLHTSAAGAVGTQTNHPLLILTNNGEKIRVTTTGNVGIGNSSPSTSLHVYATNSGTPDGSVTNLMTGVTARFHNNSVGFDIGTYSNGAGFIQSRNTSNHAAFFDLILCPTGGNVGIGSASPTHRLYVTGNIYATGDVFAGSDIRIKTNVEQLTDCLDKVKMLNGYSYNKNGAEYRSIGLIAQEVEKIIPEVVSKNTDEMKGIDYGQLVAVLVEAIKELNNKLENLNGPSI